MNTYIQWEKWVGLPIAPCDDADVDDCDVDGYDCDKALLHDVPHDHVHGCCGHHYDGYWNDAYLLRNYYLFHTFLELFLCVA